MGALQSLLHKSKVSPILFYEISWQLLGILLSFLAELTNLKMDFRDIKPDSCTRSLHLFTLHQVHQERLQWPWSPKIMVSFFRGYCMPLSTEPIPCQGKQLVICPRLIIWKMLSMNNGGIAIPYKPHQTIILERPVKGHEKGHFLFFYSNLFCLILFYGYRSKNCWHEQ